MLIRFNTFTRRLFFTSGVAGAVLAFASQAHGAMLQIEVVPSETEVNVGDTFTVDLVANILNGGNEELAIWAMDLNLSNGSLASETNLDIADPWTQFNAGDNDGLAAWTIPAIDGVADQQSDIHLATLTFTAQSAGELNLIGSFANDGFEEFGFIDVSTGDISLPSSVEFINGTITIIPLPASVLLAGIGLGTLGIFRRRFFQQAC